jgi:hypothetical protein
MRKAPWIAVLVLAIGACSSPLETADIERQVARQPDQSNYDQWGTITYDVECPDDIDGKTGYRFTCDYVIDDSRGTTTGNGTIGVEVLNNGGQVLIDGA